MTLDMANNSLSEVYRPMTYGVECLRWQSTVQATSYYFSTELSLITRH